jgi:hypothetical protein
LGVIPLFLQEKLVLNKFKNFLEDNILLFFILFLFSDFTNDLSTFYMIDRSAHLLPLSWCSGHHAIPSTNRTWAILIVTHGFGFGNFFRSKKIRKFPIGSRILAIPEFQIFLVEIEILATWMICQVRLACRNFPDFSSGSKFLCVRKNPEKWVLDN